MKEQKKYHQRKLAIIEMIESCEEYIKRENGFLNRFKGITDVLSESNKNIARYEKIKAYLLIRYKK